MPDDWSRRSLLASLGTAALAGCPSATGPDSSGDTESGASTATADGDTPTATPPPTRDRTPTAEPVGTPDPPESIDSEWPLPAHDPGRSNYAAAASGPTEPVAELWAITTDAALSAPVLAEGTVYVGGDDGVVRAFDARTGAKRWQQSVGGTAGTPRAVEDTVYVPARGAVVALDAQDGTEAWAVETDQPIGDFVAAGHGLYYVTDDPSVEAIDETPSVVGIDHTGDERWRTTIEDPWQATVFAGEDRVFVPTDTYDMRPWMFATDTGDVLNDRRPIRGADFPSARFYRDGRLVSIDGFFGNVRSIPVGDATNSWSRGIGKPGQYAVGGGTDRLYILNKSYDDSGVRLLGVSLADGTVDWETTRLAGWTDRPVVVTEGILVNTGERLRCFAPGDGTERWSRPASAVGDRFAVVDDLVVTTDGSTVRALRPP